MSKLTHVVIIGGGYAGCDLAKRLDSHMQVTLIEQRRAFVHSPAMIRALVKPELIADSIIPYDHLLKNGKVIQAKVTEIGEQHVRLDSGEQVDADYIVVATGSQNLSVFKPQESQDTDAVDAMIAANLHAHEQIKSAHHIAIVGAGAVGIELAGEIAAAKPDKQLTLISSDQRLLPTFPASLGKSITKKLTAASVDIVLGQRVTDLADRSAPFSAPLTLDNGQVIDADLVFPCIGSRANTSLFDGMEHIKHGSGGRIKTNAQMQIENYPRVFLLGDVGDVGDAMTIVAQARQVPWLAKTLKQLAQGKALTELSAFKPWKNAPILLPLGEHTGSSHLMVMTAGNWITRMMKGKDLFIPKYQKLLGHQPHSQ